MPISMDCNRAEFEAFERRVTAIEDAVEEARQGEYVDPPTMRDGERARLADYEVRENG